MRRSGVRVPLAAPSFPTPDSGKPPRQAPQARNPPQCSVGLGPPLDDRNVPTGSRNCARKTSDPQRLLKQPVDDARHVELSDPAIRFGDFQPFNRPRRIGSIERERKAGARLSPTRARSPPVSRPLPSPGADDHWPRHSEAPAHKPRTSSIINIYRAVEPQRPLSAGIATSAIQQ
jgi:hypothetical protein